MSKKDKSAADFNTLVSDPSLLEYEEDTDGIGYRLTLGSCMQQILLRYGIDITHITITIAEHMLKDLMDLLVMQGFVTNINQEETYYED